MLLSLGLRVGDLRDMAAFEQQLRIIVDQFEKGYVGLKIDVEAELEYYRSIRDEILELTVDTVTLTNNALANGQKVLVEGANATMLDIDFGILQHLVFFVCKLIGDAFCRHLPLRNVLQPLYRECVHWSRGSSNEDQKHRWDCQGLLHPSWRRTFPYRAIRRSGAAAKSSWA